MTTQQLLTQQINRLMISDERKKALLKELEFADEKKLQFLNSLIAEQDEASLKVIDEKENAQQEAKKHIFERVFGEKPKSESFSEEEQKAYFAKLGEVFKDPVKLAKLLQVCDDRFLRQLEEFFAFFLQQQPQEMKKVRQFFKEARLLKTSLEKEWRKRKKNLVEERKASLEKQSKELDQLIKRAQDLLRESRKK